MGILKKSAKLVLSFLMIITCSNFFTVRAEDGEETNYSEPVLVETVNEETTSDSLEEVLDEPVIEEVIGEEVIVETTVADEVESVVETEPSKLVVKSENEEQLEDEEVEEEIVLSRAMRKVAPVYDATTVIEVPIEGMVIDSGIFYGISKTWYNSNFPENPVIEISLTIPSDVTTISNDAFRANYTYVKDNKGCITENKFKVVSVDFSNATNLARIESQAAMNCSSLSGVLDLSKTNVEFIGKNAFYGCKNLTGVILPQTVKNIGDASSGSVFSDCTSLQFIRVAGGNPSANFELPNHLKTIGYRSFYNCSSLPANTTAIIPESVTFIGNEAFNRSNNITTILIQRDNASGYGDVAFKGSIYGISNRLTVFKNLDAKNSYPAGGNNSYKESLTYEFTLNYGTIKTEKKLWGQPVSVCKDDAGNWYNNVEYTIPAGEWSYNNLALTKTTVLKPDSDELTLKVSYALREPTIQFIVDGEVIETTGTHLELNLSNNKEHTIGVKASHHAQTDPNSSVNIKFEYKWTDIWGLGTEGPRMNESGFGRYNLWDNPNVTNTITINGPTHERTKTGNYSGDDYGDGYYLVEIYGYYTPKTGGERKLFYKSASTAIASDPERTTNTAYLFDVVTSDPASAPKVDFVVDEAVYGYEDAKKIKATVEDIDGQTNTYQWYRASKDEPNSNGEKIDGATSPILDIENELDAGEYYYYLEVTSKKTLNNDISQKNHPVSFVVTKADTSIEAESSTKKYDGKPLEGKANPVVTEHTVVTYRTKEKEEGTWSDWNSEIPSITNAGKLWVEAKTENPNYKDATVAYILEVTKLEITLTSGSASKEYDGKPLTKPGVVISGDKFIEDEVTDVQATGTITNVGSVDNTIKIVATDKFNENNYAIKYELGKLTITKKPDSKSEPTEKPKGCPANTVWNEEKGICEAIVVPLTPIKGGGQKVTPKPTPTPAPTPKPTASPTIEPTSTPKPMATEETEIIIEPNATPEVAGKGHWALINLISAIGSVLFGILLLASKHEDDDETRKRNRMWKIVAVVDALAAIVVFVLTENMKLSMVLVDKWTILMVLLIIVNIVSFAFGKKYHDEEE